MRIVLSFFVFVSIGMAASSEHPTGNRTTPPMLSSVYPVGLSRGTTVEVNIDGLNLTNTSGIFFSEPGVTGKIVRVKELPDQAETRLGSNGTPSTVDVGPLPPRNQVTVEVTITPEANIGPLGFRLQTPLGTTPEGKMLVEPYYGESPDSEPNDTPEQAFECFLPTILAGTISKPGDVDYFKVKVDAGQQLVFQNGAALIGSSLQAVVTIFDADQHIVGEYGNHGGRSAVTFAHKFEKAGAYYIRVSDYQETGKSGHYYRILVGKYALVEAVYPLGVERGKTRDIALSGYNVAAKISVKGGPDEELELRPARSFNDAMLAVGIEPELDSQGGPIPIPVTINGRIAAAKSANSYRFQATKGQKLVFEVEARRLGSELDSVLDVLDAKGNPVERAVVRSVLETSLTLRDHDSSQGGMRITASTGLHPGDYLMVGSEIVRIRALPKGPDDDMSVDNFGGQRIAYAGTTPEAHAVDQAVYKVQLHPPGTHFAPNGLPTVHLMYRNDDGGPGFGKDSLLTFTAPSDGEYQIRIGDVRAMGGEKFSYRLTVRPPRGDFRLSVNPANPNVPAGGCIPVTVTARRLDDFDGPIAVELPELPSGLHATKGVIAPGQFSTTLLLSADENATLDRAVPFRARGMAGDKLVHDANPRDHLQLITVTKKSDLLMTAQTKEVTLNPDGTAEVKVAIRRQNGFGGRVPVEVRNLPPQVRVLDVGLNGVLLNENETERTFTLKALADAGPIEQWIYVSGLIETRSGQQNSFASPQPILLKVKAAQ